MACCFSFMFLMFQFDGQDVLVPYTHYQRNKGIGSKYYLRGTIYSVRSHELTKMQETSWPVLSRSFVQAFFLSSLALKQRLGATQNGKGGFARAVQPPKWSRHNCTAPEMIPTPKWSPTLKWSPNRPRNDPQLILGMEWYSVTELLQICCSVYVLKWRLTFRYSLCDFLALLSSNRLYVNVCIFNIILKF